MSVLTLSDGQRIESAEISKVELYEEDQNLLITLRNGRLVGVHGDGTANDADLLDAAKELELLTYPVYRKKSSNFYQ